MKKSEDHRDEEEIRRINRIQRDFFSGLIEVFDPPLPEGVPQRLEQIVAAGAIQEGDIVLDVGSGTGILIPIIQTYSPERIVACDLSEAMLDHLKGQYPFVHTITGDIRTIKERDETFHCVFVNACFPNIIDKEQSFRNIVRMMKTAGRLVISHPMGKSFIEKLKDRSPFPLDDFPEKEEADIFFNSIGMEIVRFVDEKEIYLLLVEKMK